MPKIPYREPEGPERGPLTFRERVRSVLKGLMRFEPLLEMNRRGMEAGIPREERMRHAIGLGKSCALEDISSYLSREKDPIVIEALAYAYKEAYLRMVEYYDTSMCSIFTVAGSEAVKDERNQYVTRAKKTAEALIKDRILTQDAKDALETVSRHRLED